MKITRHFAGSLVLAMCLALVLPSLSLAQPGIVARFKAEGARYDNAIGQLRGVSVKGKSALTENDLSKLDSWIQTHVNSLQFAQSRAFAAGLRVTSFEQGVKEAAKGKDPRKFIADLQADPSKVLQIRGASEARRPIEDAIQASKSEAAEFRAIGETLQAFGKKSASLVLEDRSPERTVTRAGFKPVGSLNYSLATAALRSAPEPAPALQTGVIEGALITLAAAYLGIEVQRLKNGDIKKCVDKAFNEYLSCRRSSHNTAQRALCLGAFYLQVDFCVVFPF